MSVIILHIACERPAFNYSTSRGHVNQSDKTLQCEIFIALHLPFLNALSDSADMSHVINRDTAMNQNVCCIRNKDGQIPSVPTQKQNDSDSYSDLDLDLDLDLYFDLHLDSDLNLDSD